MQIEKFSFGTGDRFGKEGMAQLSAIQEINRLGIPVVPVWNKSNREHAIIHSMPASVKAEAEAAVAEGRYAGMYYTDADHINLETVDRFVDSCNFFTIDVAHFIGMKASGDAVADFVTRYRQYLGSMRIPGIAQKLDVTVDFLTNHAENYLTALEEVKKIYDHICAIRGESGFITEVSVDEADYVQGPLELFFILAELKEKGIKVQTIAPKFSGLFAKGVDYIGDVDGFAREFEQDVLVIEYAVKRFGLPENLKLSVHSGSDKFSIYPVMAEIIKKYDKGLHLKTAGTTWLEEVIGLAVAGDEALEAAKEIYIKALGRKEELCAPYADVIQIDDHQLPSAEEVNGWSSSKFADTLRHIPGHPDYNPNFRQLIHVGYKVASEMGTRYTDLLKRHKDVIGQCVEENIYERHLKRLFNL